MKRRLWMIFLTLMFGCCKCDDTPRTFVDIGEYRRLQTELRMVREELTEYAIRLKGAFPNPNPSPKFGEEVTPVPEWRCYRYRGRPFHKWLGHHAPAGKHCVAGECHNCGKTVCIEETPH